MRWVRHSDLSGKHALLGASKFHWINYSEEKLVNWYKLSLAKERGLILHDFASRCLYLRQRLPKRKKTLNMFVNDCIEFDMRSEQILWYSDNCFGTADAIGFDGTTLRISDLKTGSTPAHMEQLFIYAALFCLEYNVDPFSVDIQLRIYQNDEISFNDNANETINEIMNKIEIFDSIINNIKEEGV